MVGLSLGGFSLGILTKTRARRTAPLVLVDEDCAGMACVYVDSMRARLVGSRGCRECGEQWRRKSEDYDEGSDIIKEAG